MHGNPHENFDYSRIIPLIPLMKIEYSNKEKTEMNVPRNEIMISSFGWKQTHFFSMIKYFIRVFVWFKASKDWKKDP